MKRALHDVFRVSVLFVVAWLLVAYADIAARVLNAPALSPWGMFTGLALFGVALSHVLRRLMFPYIDLRISARMAMESSIGSGLVFLGVCLVLYAFIGLLGNVVHADELPPNALKYIPILKAEQRDWWADMPLPSSLAAQVEQETCISLKSSRCWSPRAELRTSRERGVGFGQITKTARFDALAEIRAANPAALSAWSWDDAVVYDPHFQMRALVLKDLQGYRSMKAAASATDQLAFMFAAYNGGIGGVLSDRQLCRGTRGCDSARWFGHVEHTSLKRKSVASGYGKSFFEINREYVRNVLLVRRAKYVAVMS